MFDKKIFDKYLFELILWLSFFILPLSFYPKIINSSWISNSDVHAIIEFSSSLLALIAAGLIIIHFFATGQKMFLLISVGFTLQGAEDLIHAICSFSRIWQFHVHNIEYFIPATYVAGRAVLILCFLIAFIQRNIEIESSKRKSKAIKYNIIGFFISASFTLILSRIHLPKIIFVEYYVSRPLDLIAAVIFFTTILLYISYYFKGEKKSFLLLCFIISLVLGFVSEIYMIHSQKLYDAQFDMAHLLKILSYIFPIFGIAIGTFSMYKDAALLSRRLKTYMQREKDLAIKAATADIEKQKALELEKALISAEENRKNAEAAKSEAEIKTKEFERMINLMLGRERRMIELKQEIKKLKSILSKNENS